MLPKNMDSDKHSSLFNLFISDEEDKIAWPYICG